MLVSYESMPYKHGISSSKRLLRGEIKSHVFKDLGCSAAFGAVIGTIALVVARIGNDEARFVRHHFSGVNAEKNLMESLT
jgi:hypothetical protein